MARRSSQRAQLPPKLKAIKPQRVSLAHHSPNVILQSKVLQLHSPILRLGILKRVEERVVLLHEALEYYLDRGVLSGAGVEQGSEMQAFTFNG